MIKLNKVNFITEVVGSKKPVLVDFWAEWCGPCRMVAPILEEIEREFGEKLSIGKVNTDEESELAKEFSIRSIPTLLLFAEGKIVKEIIGAKPKGILLKEISPFLSV